MSETSRHLVLVEASRANVVSLSKHLVKRDYTVDVVHSGAAAIASAQANPAAAIIVHAASMNTSGARICRSLRRELGDDVKLLLLVEKDVTVKDNVGADEVVKMPFTSRRVVNVLKKMVPPDDIPWLRVGPIALCEELDLVRCNGKETQLTPRVTKLLKYMMERPNVIVERRELMEHVWETIYIGDTRTLEVHVSWARRAIEKNPRKPQYLRTIRGKGYSLNIEV